MPADIIKRTNAAPTTVHSWKKTDLSSPCIVERSNGLLDGRADREIRFWPIGKASFCSPTITSQESPPQNHLPRITAQESPPGSCAPSPKGREFGPALWKSLAKNSLAESCGGLRTITRSLGM